MQPYGMDLRRRIIAACEQGQRVVDIMERFSVSRSTVDRYWRRYQDQGHCRPGRHGGYRRSGLEGHDGRLRQWIEVQPDLTLEELCERCQSELGVTIAKSALHQRLAKLGLTFKKNPARRRARASRH